MKNFLIIFFLLATLPVVGQDEKVYDDREVDSVPQFPGGPLAFLSNLEKTINASKKYKRKIDYVTFTVEKNGAVSGMTAFAGSEKLSAKDNDILETKSPKWKPAILNGQPVKCTYFASLYPVKRVALEKQRILHRLLSNRRLAQARIRFGKVKPLIMPIILSQKNQNARTVSKRS